MSWTYAFIWTTVAALVATLVTFLLGWDGLAIGILSAWTAFVLLVVMTRGMRWTSGLTYLSALALLGGVGAQLAGLESIRNWFLLAWAILLLPTVIGLFSHPMRTPAWGLFVGFWGAVGVMWLIVIQIFVVSGVLGGHVYNEWAAWPLALVGIWLGVAACLGLGCKEFPRWVDGLGVLAGLGLIAISVSTWIGAPGDVTRVVGSFAAIAYIAWAVAFGRMLWGTAEVTHRFMGRLDSVRGYV
jgi:hypothetical protein